MIFMCWKRDKPFLKRTQPMFNRAQMIFSRTKHNCGKSLFLFIMWQKKEFAAAGPEQTIFLPWAHWWFNLSPIGQREGMENHGEPMGTHGRLSGDTIYDYFDPLMGFTSYRLRPWRYWPRIIPPISPHALPISPYMGFDGVGLRVWGEGGGGGGGGDGVGDKAVGGAGFRASKSPFAGSHNSPHN